MSESTEQRKRRRGFGLWIQVCIAVLVVLGVTAALLLSGREITIPQWVTARFERELGVGMAGGSVDVGSATVRVGPDWSPVVSLNSVALSDRTSLPIAEFSSIQVTFSAEHALRAEIRPRTINLSGASLALRREPDGRFDLSLETGQGGLGSTGSMADVLDSIDRAFAAPWLASVETVRAADVTFQYEDVRAARYWLATGGSLELDQDARRIEMRLRFGLLYGEDTPADASLTFTSFKESTRATIAASVTDLPAADFSTQAPALAWLSVLDAPVSGAVRAGIGPDGALTGMSGTLDIGAGALQPTAETHPIGFDAGRAYFTYDPERERIRFDELSVSTEAVTLRGEGHAYLRDMVNGWPQTLLAQLQFEDLRAYPVGTFDAPVGFDGGALDLRLRLDPFTLSIGQLVLFDQGTHLIVDGEVAAGSEGWLASIDLTLDRITPQRLMVLWPEAAISGTRTWLAENVIDAVLHDVTGAIRLRPGSPVVGSLGFSFSDATVRYMNTLPVVTGGAGYGALHGERFTLVIEEGQVEAPEGGTLDVADTVLSVPDIAAKPAILDVALRARGPIPAALSVLDEPPFRFMTKGGNDTDIADGRANVTANISLPLLKRLALEDVDYRVRASLIGVTSEKLIENRTLQSDLLTLRASSEGLEISGAGQIGSVPFHAAWTQSFGPEHRGKSQVEGTIELSQAFADEFNIGLPDGSLSGEASGRISIDLERGAAPRFNLTSDLNRLGMNLADIGWSKAQNGLGALEVAGTLGQPAEIETLRLSAAGLEASGSVSLNDDGTMNEMRFDRVRVGDWLEAPIVLTGRGPGVAPMVTITGGRIDTRSAGFGGGGGNGQGGPISAQLDQLVVSEGITLTDFSGNFDRQPGFNGRFTARVNGVAPVSGGLAPQNGGTAIRVRSDDAGAVLRAMGVFDIAHGGNMELILAPRARKGVYDGSLTITDRVRVRGAPVLAELLGAISVIGLLEQLNGQGLAFSTAEARFRLTPEQLIVSRSSAVGPSLGVSLNGVYDLAAKRMDMQGVISPIYVVNGIGAILTRRGEGLFGFNFRMTGPGSSPRIAVNPLSILTPGMFRDLFRRPPPELPE